MGHKDEEPFTNSMLPESRPPWRSVASSLIIQGAFVLAVLTLSYAVAEKVDIESRYFKLTYTKTELVSPRIVHAKSGMAPAPAPLGDIELAQQPKRPAFQPVLSAPAVKKLPAKSVSVPEIATENPVLPVPEVGMLAEARGPQKPREEIHTGTFGSEGPEPVSGNGSHNSVALAGLGDGAGNQVGAHRNERVQSAKFEQFVDGPAKPSRVSRNAELVAPVQIKFKPKPVYTPEARNKQVQGDVVLEVVFLASGQIVVNRVVSGLGYGLDEAAQDAAMHIQFAPARLEDGKTIDTKARIHIVFQLAS